MKRTSVILIALVLAGASGAKAQQFDLSTMTCASFMKGDKNEMKLVAAWLAGYYTSESAAEVVDLPALDNLQNELTKFCARETSFPIASAADGILGHEPSTDAAAAAASSKTR